MEGETGSDRVGEIVRLFGEAKSEHIVYERDLLNGVWDEAWPAWYAAYLVEHGILRVVELDAQNPKEDLARLLAEADRLHQQEAPQEEWPGFYARYLLGARSGAPGRGKSE